MKISRRRFIQSGFFSVLLSALPVSAISLKRLNESDADFLRALIPVMLDGYKLSQSDIEQIVQAFDISIEHMEAGFRDELGELFWLLSNRFSRVILCGIWQDWDKVPEYQMRRFVERWKRDNLKLLADAYIALHDLSLGAWYSLPQSWPVINYPKPLYFDRVAK